MEYNLKYPVQCFTIEKALKNPVLYHMIMKDKYLYEDEEDKELLKLYPDKRLRRKLRFKKADVAEKRDIVQKAKCIAVCRIDDQQAKNELKAMATLAIEKIEQTMFTNVDFYFVF